jgi:hypothetical protein
MRILQVGVPFTIVGRSRKSWNGWNRNSVPGCDATLRAHSDISQQTPPEYGLNVSSKRTIDALIYAANNAVSDSFFSPMVQGRCR